MLYLLFAALAAVLIYLAIRYARFERKIGGMRPIGVAVLWFAGMSGLGLLWLLTQPLFRQGRGLRGFFVRPGRGQWRVMNLHRAYWDMERGQKRRGHTRSV